MLRSLQGRRRLNAGITWAKQLVAVLFVAGAGGCIVVAYGQAQTLAPTSFDRTAVSNQCRIELTVGSVHYRPARLPRGSVQAGARLRSRGQLSCEQALVCNRASVCTVSRNASVGRISAHLIRGVRGSLALIDLRTRQVYVNRAVFDLNVGGKQLLHSLRERGRVPLPRTPPGGFFIADQSTVPLGFGSYCWSWPSGQEWVQQCITMVPPWRRLNIPVVSAETGASLHVHLGISDPESVTVAVFGRQGVSYSRSLPVSPDVTWTVPARLPRDCFVEIHVAVPSPSGLSDDWATYLAHLYVSR